MFRKLIWGVILLMFVALVPGAAAQDSSTVFLRLLQLANDGSTVTLTLSDGRTAFTAIAPGSATDYVTLTGDRSTLVTVSITPTNQLTYVREWAIPPLAPGYHTMAVVGSGRENTIQLLFIDEDSLCAGKLDAGSCVILVDSLRGSPPLTVFANSTQVMDDVNYRQTVVSSVAAGTYQDFMALNQNNTQQTIFHLQREIFEPNVVHVYTLRGNYPGTINVDYSIGTLKRAAVDSMTFLRGLTADLQLSDGTTLFSAENTVAVLEAAGLGGLLANPDLPLTVFVPTDQAVLATAPDLYECLLSNPAAAQALILNHVLVGTHNAQELVSAGRLPSMAGTTHTFTRTNGGFFIDGTARVADSVSYPTNNGYVYLMNAVLIPPGFEDRYCASG